MILDDMTLVDESGEHALTLTVSELVVAGWTARNVAAMEAHIAELEALGISRPKATPTYYRNGANLLTTDDAIEVVGATSSGEVEFVLFAHDGAFLVGLGSDHTDREVEKSGVTISKQICPKPVARAVWRYDEVKDHWGDLILRSHAIEGDARTLYQEGPVTTMRDPMELVAGYCGTPEARPGLAMFCGTLAVHGGVRPMGRFEIELDDPVLGRRIDHSYGIAELPIAG
jgi:hypothetical protein